MLKLLRKLKPNQTDDTCHLNAGLGSCLLIKLLCHYLLLMSAIQTQVRSHLHDWQVRKSTYEPFEPSAPVSHTALLIWIVLKVHFVGQTGLFHVWNPTTYQLFFIPLTRTSYQVGQETYWNTDKDPIAKRFLRIPFFFFSWVERWVSDWRVQDYNNLLQGMLSHHMVSLRKCRPDHSAQPPHLSPALILNRWWQRTD